jgi:hypothetical protein
MANLIEQQPLFTTFPVGQDIIFSISNASVFQIPFVNVKFIADVYISDEAIVISSGIGFVGSFKTTPNAVGVGMFDLSSIVESFVNPDNLAGIGSGYKSETASIERPIPLHLINEYSTNNNTLKYLSIRFKVEGALLLDEPAQVLTGQGVSTTEYTFFNGYLKHTDKLSINTIGNFGYSTNLFQLNTVNPSIRKYLSNAPTTQYANATDYGTISYLTTPVAGFEAETTLKTIRMQFYDIADSLLTTVSASNNLTQGGFFPYTTSTKNQLLHFGCFPGNLQNYSTNVQTIIANNSLSYYKITPLNKASDQIGEVITIKLNCPNLKGYEPIRLTWLNQWGVWDYYTFTQLSSKSISTKGSTYQQLEGTWNKKIYQVNGFKGGKKSFRVNATEKIKMNTDFVSETESEWFEELINSPEVYILEGYEDIVENRLALNQYVTPVRLTTSNYVRKTVANDKLIQYTFEVEKSKTLRTQAV